MERPRLGHVADGGQARAQLGVVIREAGKATRAAEHERTSVRGTAQEDFARFRHERQPVRAVMVIFHLRAGDDEHHLVEVDLGASAYPPCAKGATAWLIFGNSTSKNLGLGPVHRYGPPAFLPSFNAKAVTWWTGSYPTSTTT
jgi:hypothetical protein